ncbi:AroM family protein [Lentzea sp. NPDC058436]|uniref:AroM family protein n=1 Tax=Lentzea sp. NPDC058436 TaxID=3346499 RepID=UPI0036613EAB
MALVALVHATPAPMAPAADAFATAMPDARLWNVLDDTLITDAEQAGSLTPELRDRMRTLIGYAVDSGADAVLLTCSIYGPVTAELDHPVPVLPPDRALFEEVARLAPARVLVLGPAEAGARDTADRLRAHLGAGAVVEGVAVAGVRDALAAGDVAHAAELVVSTVRAHDTDVVVLGQFSLAPVAEAVAAALDVPVLSAPQLAARAIRAALGG